MKNKSTRYKNGGTSKNEWISDKISKMLSEGKDLNQSTAIANAMYNSGLLEIKFFLKIYFKL